MSENSSMHEDECIRGTGYHAGVAIGLMEGRVMHETAAESKAPDAATGINLAGLPAGIVRARQTFYAEMMKGPYSGWLHLALVNITSLALIAICMGQLEAVTALEWWTIPIAFVYANMAEYWGHRGPMHRPFKFLRTIYHRHAGQHHTFFTDEHMEFRSHKDFKAVLFPLEMVLFFGLGFALPLWIILTVLISENTAWLAVATGAAYYLHYEWLHFVYHYPRNTWLGRLPLMKVLRKLHQTHHNQSLMTRYNFNITYPIGDWLFGTLYSADEDADRGSNQSARSE